MPSCRSILFIHLAHRSLFINLADRSCLLYQLAINYVADIQLNCKFARLDGYEGPKSFTCTLGKDFKKTPQIT